MIDLLLSRLEKVTPKGQGKFTARCPAHNDKTPSLAIASLPDGRILLKCFAGCGASDIVQVIGLTLADLFPDGHLKYYRGFQQIENDQKEARKEKLFKEHAILEICKSWREQGIRLTPQDLKREQEAYLKVRNENNK